MRSSIALISVLWLVSLTCAAQEETTTAKGRIVDINDEGIQGVHVLNLTTQKVAVTDTSGLFVLESSVGDKLRLTHIAMDSITLVWAKVSSDTVQLMMHDNTIVLPEITVFQYGLDYLERSKPDTIRSFGAFGNYTDRIFGNKDFYMRKVSPTSTNPVLGVNASIPGPFSLLHRAFSKKEKEKRHFKKIIERDEKYDNLAEVLDKESVRSRFVLEFDTDTSVFYQYLSYFLKKSNAVSKYLNSDYKLLEIFFAGFNNWKSKDAIANKEDD